MAIKYLRIGSMVDVVGWDNADFDCAIETDEPIKAGAPVDNNDVVRKGDMSSISFGLTQGSVVFGSATGSLGQDNSNFFWDDGNNRLGIGTNTPTCSLEISAGIDHGIAIGANYPAWLGDNGIYTAGPIYSAKGLTIATGYYLGFGNSQSRIYGNTALNTLQFYTSNNERIVIIANGDTGINYSSPDHKLTIGQSEDDEGLKIYGYDDQVAEYVAIHIRSDGTVRIDSSQDISITQNVDVIGDFTAGTIQADNGWTGSFTNGDGDTVTVVGGVITGVA